MWKNHKYIGVFGYLFFFSVFYYIFLDGPELTMSTRLTSSKLIFLLLWGSSQRRLLRHGFKPIEVLTSSPVNYIGYSGSPRSPESFSG